MFSRASLVNSFQSSKHFCIFMGHKVKSFATYLGDSSERDVRISLAFLL